MPQNRPATAHTRLRRAASTAWQRLGDEVVVLNVAQRTLTGLSPTASAWWEQLSAESSAAEAAHHLAEPLKLAPAELESELLLIAQELLRRDLVEAVPAAAAITPPAVADAANMALSPTLESLAEACAGISWEERLEDAGVYAGCAKDPFGEVGPGCTASPNALSS